MTDWAVEVHIEQIHVPSVHDACDHFQCDRSNPFQHARSEYQVAVARVKRASAYVSTIPYIAASTRRAVSCTLAAPTTDGLTAFLRTYHLTEWFLLNLDYKNWIYVPQTSCTGNPNTGSWASVTALLKSEYKAPLHPPSDPPHIHTKLLGFGCPSSIIHTCNGLTKTRGSPGFRGCAQGRLSRGTVSCSHCIVA